MRVDVIFEVIDGAVLHTMMPKRSTRYSVGYDFFAPERFIIEPQETIMIPTKIKCKLPRDMWLGVYGRSSYGMHGIINPLGVGVVDPDYYNNENNQGEISIVLRNTTNETFYIEKGDKIAQGVIHKAYLGYDEVSDKRNGGFGSTGK